MADTGVDFWSSRSQPLPLFYREPHLLSLARHGGRTLRQIDGFGFARTTNAVPLTMAEFPMAVRHYPIVFSPGDRPTALAVVGLRRDANLMLDPDGRWAPGHYVPAYIRRYPFLLLDDRRNERLALAVDEAAGLLDGAEGRPLYVEGQPSDLVKGAMKFCVEFQRQQQATRAFGEALEQAGLLEERNVRVRGAEGHAVTLRGFRVVSEEKLAALPDETYLDWRRRNWLPSLYLHLASLAYWVPLAGRARAG